MIWKATLAAYIGLILLFATTLWAITGNPVMY